MKAVDMTNVEMALRVIQERSKKSLRVDSTAQLETVGTAAGKNSSKSSSTLFFHDDTGSYTTATVGNDWSEQIHANDGSDDDSEITVIRKSEAGVVTSKVTPA